MSDTVFWEGKHCKQCVLLCNIFFTLCAVVLSRLIALRALLQSILKAEDVIKVHEARLTEKETTSLDLNEVDRYRNTLKVRHAPSQNTERYHVYLEVKFEMWFYLFMLSKLWISVFVCIYIYISYCTCSYFTLANEIRFGTKERPSDSDRLQPGQGSALQRPDLPVLPQVWRGSVQIFRTGGSDDRPLAPHPNSDRQQVRVFRSLHR